MIGLLFVLVFLVIWLAVVGAILAGLWKTAVKAGLPGWALLVPIYNLHIMLKMTNQPSWWLWAIMFIPGYNILLSYKLMVAFAALYGKSASFGLGLLVLGPVFFAMLGFGDAKYHGTTPSTALPMGGFPAVAAR